MKPMRNIPKIRMGIVGVSRDCFPMELARTRLKKVTAECRKLKLDVVEAKTIIETDSDAAAAAAEMRREGVNAVTVYLGNFGPEGPLTIFAEKMGVPFMLVGAAEESASSLVDGRGDAFCGMLSACLNAELRNLRPYLPPAPVGLPAQIAQNISRFMDVARVIVGLKNLKTFSFGPRPQDFYACNAPLRPLYNLGIEVMENSELDMLELFKSVADQKQKISAIARDMARELGKGNLHPEKLAALAQFELALTSFFEKNLGSRQFGVFANKCWPAFEKAFGFVPCYVNSRLAQRGIPAACEVDIYGAVSEYMLQLALLKPATLLDINNTVPDDLPLSDLKGANREDLFMGFHCGNTASCCLKAGCAMKYQLIMYRLMEPGKEPDITCGTLEGTLVPGPVTLFRLQAAARDELRSYVAEGEVLDADPRSFGGIGIFAVPNFARFYRYALLAKQFPHHGAVGFERAGKILYDALQMLGVTDISTPLPPERLYPGENPF